MDLDARLRSALATFVEDASSSDDALSRAMVERVVWPGPTVVSEDTLSASSGEHEALRLRPRYGVWRHTGTWVALAATAAAALGLMWLRPQSNAVSPSLQSEVPGIPLARKQTVPSSQSDGAQTPLYEGLLITAGHVPHHVTIADPIDLYLAPGAIVRVASMRPGEIELNITHGRAIAHVREAQPSMTFSIRSNDTVATASAAVFAMEVAADVATLHMDVHQGTVRLTRSSETLELGPAVSAHSQGSELTVGPLNADRLAADNAWLVAAGAAPVAEDFAVPREKRESSAPGRTAVQLLADARAALSLERPHKAARLYEELLERHSRSDAAGPAMIALGRLYLHDLQRPRAAEKLFRRYLRTRRGPLSVEARLGRIEALRRLGQSQAEVAAIRELVKHHPESNHARSLRLRLHEITP